METAALKSAFDVASAWAEYATIAVAFGVFIELVALFIFSKEMPPLEKKVIVFATLLIVGGCVGEYIFGSRANVAASQLQEAQETATQNAKREQERLKAIVNWRTIPADNFRKLVISLSKIGGTVTLRYVATDAEALGYAVQLAKAFEQANQIANRQAWTLRADPHLYPSRLVFLLHVPDLKNTSSQGIKDAFTASGIVFQPDDVTEQSNVSAGIAGMTIGPMPLQTEALIIIGSKQPPF